MITDIVKVFFPAICSFILGIIMTPILTNYLYKYQMWKKKAGKVALDGREAQIFNSLHKEKEVGTPRMGGVIIWLSASITAICIWILSHLIPIDTMTKLDFISRNQTWIPLTTLIIGSLVGLIDDILEVRYSKDGKNGGLSIYKRLGAVAIMALFCAWWFYEKLDISTIALPHILGEIPLGVIFIPIFILIAIALYASGVIDGIDGLAGGIFATIFASYAGIAFYQQQINLSAFCATIVGALLAFLWFNIPPARFYMSETGTMGLTITLAVVAFMTDKLGGGYGVSVLPIIALPLVITVLSNIIQITSKKIRGKKIFLVAPIHHHFEAIGWPSYKITMRYWIFGVICAILGIILALVG